MKVRYNLAALAGATFAILMVGCSDNDDGFDDLTSRTLTISDFPADAKDFAEIGTDKTASYGNELSDSLRTTTYTPASCKAPREKQAEQDMSMHRVGVVNIDKQSLLQYNAYVTKGGESIDLIQEMFYGPCVTVKMERRPEGSLGDTTTLVTQGVEPPSNIHAEQVLMFQQRSTVTQDLPGDMPISKTSLFGFARTNGVIVSLQQTAYDSKSTNNQDEFTTIFEKAIAKANS